VREEDLIRKVRSPKGQKAVARAISKQTAPPPMNLATLQRARAATTHMLANERATTDEYAALSVVVKALQPKRVPTETEITLFATLRDGSPAEREAVIAVYKEAARLVSPQSDTALFKSSAPQKRSKLSGMFFRS
jgi:hypothetical protein